MVQAAGRRAAKRMPANAREARRQMPRRLDNRALRAAGVSHDCWLAHVLVELADERQVLTHRRRQNHDVRLGQDDEVVGRDIDGVQPHRCLEHVLVVDADDKRARPDLPGRQRDRSADQAQTDNPDPGEEWRLTFGHAPRLDDG